MDDDDDQDSECIQFHPNEHRICILYRKFASVMKNFAREQCMHVQQYHCEYLHLVCYDAIHVKASKKNKM